MKYFWGPEDSSVHFCESKYTHVYWIAEYYNTISCFFYLLAGCVLWKYQNKKLFGISIILVGLGSIMLHMTMRCYGQWFDEISMLITTFLGMKKMKIISNYFLAPVILLYYYLHEYFSYFLIIFLGSQIYIMYKSVNLFIKRRENIKKKTLLASYICFFIIGTSCWLVDQIYCEEFREYNLHAWWHFFTALGAYCGILALS
jgi:dihydroceramidase